MMANEIEETIIMSNMTSEASSTTTHGGGSGGSCGGGGGGLLPEPIKGVRDSCVPPFVTRLYEMVSKKSTNSIISWVSKSSLTSQKQVEGGATSFVIWDDGEFVNNVLPLMSKSRNLESFVTQLNSYGFKKLSWDRREYANEWFVEGKPELLKNIKRRNQNPRSSTDELSHEIQKLKQEDQELDHELNAFKEYVETKMYKQKRIIQAIAKAMKSTFDLYRARNLEATNEVDNGHEGEQGLTIESQLKNNVENDHEVKLDSGAIFSQSNPYGIEFGEELANNVNSKIDVPLEVACLDVKPSLI